MWQLGVSQFTIETLETFLRMLRAFSPYLKLLQQHAVQHKELLGR
jgi:hypothetical protein